MVFFCSDWQVDFYFGVTYMPVALWTEQCMVQARLVGLFDHCRHSGSGFVLIIQIEPCFSEVVIPLGGGLFWTLVGEMSATDKPMAQACM